MGCTSSRDSAVVEPAKADPAKVESHATPRAPTPPPKIKATLVFVCGPPAVGKGTQCARIRDQFGYVHLSTGDLLRDEVARGTARGKRAAEVMAAGGLVSDDVVLELLRDAIDSTSGPHRHFLIDGFPSTESQAAAFERAIGEPAFVLALEAPDAVLRTRPSPPGLAATDAEAAFDARLRAFRDQTQPVLDRYGQLGVLRCVDADQSADEVFAEVALLFEAQVGGGWGVGSRARWFSELRGLRKFKLTREPSSAACPRTRARWIAQQLPPSATTVLCDGRRCRLGERDCRCAERLCNCCVCRWPAGGGQGDPVRSPAPRRLWLRAPFDGLPAPHGGR